MGLVDGNVGIELCNLAENVTKLIARRGAVLGEHNGSELRGEVLKELAGKSEVTCLLIELADSVLGRGNVGLKAPDGALKGGDLVSTQVNVALLVVTLKGDAVLVGLVNGVVEVGEGLEGVNAGDEVLQVVVQPVHTICDNVAAGSGLEVACACRATCIVELAKVEAACLLRFEAVLAKGDGHLAVDKAGSASAFALGALLSLKLADGLSNAGCTGAHRVVLGLLHLGDHLHGVGRGSYGHVATWGCAKAHKEAHCMRGKD